MALGTATAPYELRFDAGRICLDLLATSHPEEIAPLRALVEAEPGMVTITVGVGKGELLALRR